MTTSAKVYIARLAGVAVFDPNGDLVGKLRDAVVTLRIGNMPPRVLGAVVEMQHRRRIFVPMGRVTSVDADAVVLSTGTVNLRRFEQRPGETLVLGELLDRRVTVVESGERMVVVDAAMEQTRTRDWVLSRLAVRETGRIPRRRGQIRQVEWSEVTGLARSEDRQGAENFLAVLATLRPPDVATVMQDLSDKRRYEVAQALDDERLADVLEELPEPAQAEILTRLTDDRAVDVLGRMGPDDAADLLTTLPPAERQRLLGLMEPGEAEPVRQLLTYTEGTAGSLMTSEPIILPPDATVAEALARVRNPDLSPALASQVYVCRPPSATPTGRYLGTAHFQRLLREPPSSLVSGVADEDIDALHPETPMSEVTRHLAAYNLVAVAIVDEQGRLVGAVTVDDILDALLPEGWRAGAGHG
ncbi:MAG TPA: CBS domain-containing protein [Mycobacteriales bacterium]|nr:CBS domain-containing protein [Mycobacteriales bacterium]